METESDNFLNDYGISPKEAPSEKELTPEETIVELEKRVAELEHYNKGLQERINEWGQDLADAYVDLGENEKYIQNLEQQLSGALNEIVRLTAELENFKNNLSGRN